MHEKSSLTGAPLDQVAIAKYRNIVYYLTFFAYAMSHFSRKSYTNVKVQLKTKAGIDPILLSQMDTTFMFFYAIGSFFSGKLGDTFHAPTVIGIGLLGSACCVFALVVGVWTDVAHSSVAYAHFYFMFFWLIHGLVQSTGGPVGTAIMGNWFGAKNRGWIFGTWTCHQYIGNITAAVVASAILNSSLPWTYALLIPCFCNAIWGVLMILILPERPEHVNIETEETRSKAAAAKLSGTTPAQQLSPISFGEALRIPNVIGYALAFGFFKLINYAMFFWLPYFLAGHFTPQQSNMISVLYDVGMMPGGVIVGTVSDLFGGRRACVIVVFMGFLVPLLFLFSQYASEMPAIALLILLGIMGILVGGPNNIITSAVAADLAEHPSIKGNSRALGTVTGIINGSGSITAALGLMVIGPLQLRYGWASVWYFLILCTVIGTSLMMPKVLKEIYSHDTPEVVAPTRRGYESINRGEEKA
eukprot:gene10554-22013_t